jgi:putative transposase
MERCYGRSSVSSLEAYRRIHELLLPQFPGVNHKRVYRLYRQANLAVRWLNKGKQPINQRMPLARTVNEA